VLMLVSLGSVSGYVSGGPRKWYVNVDLTLVKLICHFYIILTQLFFMHAA
jgi:hypothetical protein